MVMYYHDIDFYFSILEVDPILEGNVSGISGKIPCVLHLWQRQITFSSTRNSMTTHCVVIRVIS